MKYDTHVIKTISGKFIVNQYEWQMIKDMINLGQDETEINGQTVSVFKDTIETVGDQRNRVTVVTVGVKND